MTKLTHLSANSFAAIDLMSLLTDTVWTKCCDLGFQIMQMNIRAAVAQTTIYKLFTRY